MAVTQLAMSRQLTVATVVLTESRQAQSRPDPPRIPPGWPPDFDRRGAHSAQTLKFKLVRQPDFSASFNTCKNSLPSAGR
jgi:hypothetical protein